MLINPCGDQLTYDAGGATRVVKMSCIVKSHCNQYTKDPDAWNEKASYIRKEELPTMDKAINTSIGNHVCYNVQYFDTPHTVHAWLISLLDHIMAGSASPMKSKPAITVPYPPIQDVEYTKPAATTGSC